MLGMGILRMWSCLQSFRNNVASLAICTPCPVAMLITGVGRLEATRQDAISTVT